MAITTVQQIITDAGVTLNDVNSVRWKKTELLGYLNDSYKIVLAFRPEAYPKTATVTLAPGPRQSISDTGSINLPHAFRLLDVIRNMAHGSNKTAIKPIERSTLDVTVPDWYVSSPSLNIEFWAVDPTNPKGFLVYPPADTGAQVELSYAEIPPPHSYTEYQLNNGEGTEVIRVDDIYAPMILDYILYRAYSKEADTANDKRVSLHYTAFVQYFTGKPGGGA